MKKGTKLVLLAIIIILIGGSINFILERNSIVKDNKQIIKEMNESTQVTDLQTQINQLNATHTEYANYVQSCKQTIATAITDMGIETSENVSVDTMASNIRSILVGSSIKFGGMQKGTLSDTTTFTSESPIKFIVIANMYSSGGIVDHIILISINDKIITYDNTDESSLFDSCITISNNGCSISVSNNVFPEGKYWPYIACFTI